MQRPDHGLYCYYAGQPCSILKARCGSGLESRQEEIPTKYEPPGSELYVLVVSGQQEALGSQVDSIWDL